LPWKAFATRAIAACGGDARETVKVLLVANEFLEEQLDELRSKVSTGYARERLPGARESRTSQMSPLCVPVVKG
jgi:hypothetical protein